MGTQGKQAGIREVFIIGDYDRCPCLRPKEQFGVSQAGKSNFTDMVYLPGGSLAAQPTGNCGWDVLIQQQMRRLVRHGQKSALR
jgi:hypothetical protein